MRSKQSPKGVSLVELLFGSYRRRILALMLLHPDESFYVREIARLTTVPAGSLHRELTALADAGLLVRTVSGNQVRYQADRGAPLFKELAGIFRKTVGVAEVLREALASLGSAARIAFVFGSVAQGREGASSDIDVMVIGSASFTRVVAALAPTQEELRREVNPVVMNVEAFRSKAIGRDRFVTRIMREPKIYLIGDDGELGKLAEDRAA